MNNITLFILSISFGMLISCTTKDESQRIYLGGYEAEFNGDAQCQKFMQTQAVDKETANDLWAAIELVFHEGKLVEAFDYSSSVKLKRTLKENEIGLPYVDIKPNQMYQIKATNKAQSYLGGECPTSFNIPKFDFVAPFQYLGMLSNKDEAFNWLPFDLHLAAPIYLNMGAVMLDYSDPNNPVVINLEELKNTENAYEDELKVDSEIVYEKKYISAKKANDYGYGFGHSGIPNWIQYPDIPTCPKSNKTMKFLVQLNSDTGIQTKRTNVTSENDFMLQYFDHLNFWGAGDLYIFFEPESKVICYLIQGT